MINFKLWQDPYLARQEAFRQLNSYLEYFPTDDLIALIPVMVEHALSCEEQGVSPKPNAAGDKAPA